MSQLNEITCEALSTDELKQETVVELNSVSDSESMVNMEWSGESVYKKEKQKSKSDDVAHIMGQYLLKGYKMLADTCPQCDCILMEDKQKKLICIGCELSGNTQKESKQSKSQTSFKILDEPLPVVPSEINVKTSSDEQGCVVQGVDLSPVLHSTVSSLKQKLYDLSVELDSATDHKSLDVCLTSMSSTVSVLERIKKL